jgi:hypothetical protein
MIVGPVGFAPVRQAKKAFEMWDLARAMCSAYLCPCGVAWSPNIALQLDRIISLTLAPFCALCFDAVHVIRS